MGEANENLALSLKGISKRFGRVKANDDIHLDVKKGCIHGIIGENGAGKSTLMNILYGFYQADKGDFIVDGKSVTLTSPKDAIYHGIGMVHQHFMLVPTFSVWENILLGSEPSAILKNPRIYVESIITKLGSSFSKDLDLDTKVEDLPVGLQQRVEIIKALKSGGNILILDEPTGVLTPQEADELFAILRGLRDDGVTILLITHKLKEIMDITDEVSVMRGGKMVAHRHTAETSPSELAELMVGRKILLNVKKPQKQIGKEILRVENASSISSQGHSHFENLSFSLRQGEILGIAGVAGNGQSELLEALAGMRSLTSGWLQIGTHKITPQTPIDAAKMREFGVAHVPEDRHRHGMVLPFSACENMVLGHHFSDLAGQGIWLDYPKIHTLTQQLIEQYDVRPPHGDLSAKSFSGGNQQKQVIAREIHANPQLLLIGQPTRGVDIGAIEFIHQQIIALSAAGTAVILVSVELDEIMSLADTILVMHEGEISGMLPRKDANEQNLGLLMAGIELDEIHAHSPQNNINK